MWYPPRCPSLLARCRRLCAVSNAGCARPASRAVGRFASRHCLLDVVAVCLDASPRHLIVSSHRSCLAACRSLRASPLLRPVIGICPGADTIPWLLASRPASSTRRTGRYDDAAEALGFACLPLARHLIHAVRHRMATGLGACLVRLPLPASVSGSSSSAPPANPIARSIRFPRRPTVPSLHLPDHSTRGTGRELLALAACLSARSLLLLGLSCCLFVRVLWRMASGVALLACLSY